MGQDHPGDPGPVGGEDLGLDAADGQHAAAEGALAGHRGVVADPAAGQQRGQGREDRDPSRGPVLRHGARGHVDVDVAGVEEVGVDPELLGVAAHEGQGRARRLLHHVTELAGDLQAALATHLRGLDEQDVPADRRPREPSGDAGDRGPLGDFVEEPALAEVLVEVGRADPDRLVLLVGLAARDEQGHVAGELAELAAELADAGLAGVVGHDLADRDVVEGDGVRPEGVLLQLAREQVALGDLQLLLRGVAVDLDDLEPVAQRRRHLREVVGRDHEHHLGHVEGQLEVMIGEGVVLLGVEQLEQRGLGRAAPARRELVDLVEEHDRVLDPGLAHRVDDAAGDRPDVGAPVTADLGLVTHATEGDAHERPAGRLGDRAPERGLADPGRAGQTQDRPLAPARQLEHGHVLEDPLLDVVEAEVVGVELGRDRVEVVAHVGALVPGQVGDGLEVGPRDRELRVRGVELGQALELSVGDLLDLLGQVRLADPVLELVDLAALVVLAELALDGLHPLAEDHVALLLAEPFAHLLVDLRAHRVDLAGLVDEPRDQAQALGDVEGHQDLDLGVALERQVGTDGVGELAGVEVLGHGLDQVAARVAGELADVLAQRLGQDLGLRRVGVEVRGRGRRDPDVGLALTQLGQVDPPEGLDDEAGAAVVAAADAVDFGEHGDRVEVGEGRVLGVGLALGRDRDDVSGGHGIDQRQRAGTPDGQGRHGAREQHATA